ncbi:TRAP transporter substrate-binding protein [Vallitalea sediminicola]
MLKKVLSTVLVIMMVSVLFVGCGEKTETSKDGENVNSNKVASENNDKQENTKSIIFRLADNHPADYPTTLGDYEFARLVEEKTEGRIKIEVFHSKQLGEEKEVIEQVQFGGIDFARVSLAPLTEFSPSLNVLILPYLYENADHMWKVLNSSIGDQFLASIESANFIGLAWYDGGARSFYNSKKEIKCLADLKGLKFRVQQSALIIDMVKNLGASPTPLPYGEVYSAIQTGVIDGAENNWPSYDTSSHFEVAKYYTIDEHLRVPEMIIASKISMEKVSDEDMILVKEAAKEAQEFQIEKWNEKEAKSEEKVKEAGCIITRLENKDEFVEAVKPLYEKYASEYTDIIGEIQDMK